MDVTTQLKCAPSAPGDDQRQVVVLMGGAIAHTCSDREDGIVQQRGAVGFLYAVHSFKQPREGDLKYNWVVANLGAIEMDEAEELLTDAWGLVVPKFLFKARLEAMGIADGES